MGRWTIQSTDLTDLILLLHNKFETWHVKSSFGGGILLGLLVTRSSRPVLVQDVPYKSNKRYVVCLSIVSWCVAAEQTPKSRLDAGVRDVCGTPLGVKSENSMPILIIESLSDLMLQ